MIALTDSKSHCRLSDVCTIPELKLEPTPFLALDLDAMEHNIALMARWFDSRPARLRPHVKHHKSTEIALMQSRAGAVGVTCSTTDEVAAMVGAGLDALLANIVTHPTRLESLAASARRGVVTVAVDSPESARLLDDAMARAKAECGVVIDMDVGMGRTGVRGVDPACELGDFVASLSNLRLRGVMAYEGHCVRIQDSREREAAVAAAFAPVEKVFRELERRGHRLDMVTGGSTSTYDASGSLAFMTDVQAGTYVLMDTSYTALTPEFRLAAVIVTSVLSSRPSGEIVVDVGSKRQATDGGQPMLAGLSATSIGPSEEHYQFEISNGVTPRVGERVAVIPGHTCTTMSMYRRAFGFRGRSLEREIAIDARDPNA